MVWETGVQSQVESYQRLKKWYLMLPYLTLIIIRYRSRVKWSNPGKGVVPFPTPWCSSYWKGNLQVPSTKVANFTLLFRLACKLLPYKEVLTSVPWRGVQLFRIKILLLSLFSFFQIFFPTYSIFLFLNLHLFFFLPLVFFFLSSVYLCFFFLFVFFLLSSFCSKYVQSCFYEIFHKLKWHKAKTQLSLIYMGNIFEYSQT